MTYAIMGLVLLFMAFILIYKAKLTKDTSHFFNLTNTTAMRGFWCIIVILVHIPAVYQNRIQDLMGSFAYIGVTFFFMTSAYKGDADCFSVDFLKLKAHLEDRFGGSWQVAFRYHPLQKKRNLPSGCIDLSTYEDMQELLMCTDILVTDYSSCMWDFSLMGKPCFVYASDIDRYINDERGAFLY